MQLSLIPKMMSSLLTMGSTMDAKCRNFVSESYNPETERGMFFNSDVIEHLQPSDRSLGHLLVRLGVYDSVADAFKARYNKPIPVGWFQQPVGVGERRVRLIIWNPRRKHQDNDMTDVPWEEYEDTNVTCNF